ncbi:MAG TPA: ABC transporter permease [Acidimicrobiales bacterium]|nr:ABC transporter permease [Acidimicrobiales bacterium]
MADARILDRSYRSYDGPRTGLIGSMRTVAVHSMRHALGIKRRHGAKVIPVLTIMLAYVPAIVFVGMVALFKSVVLREDILPTYAEYYSYISAAIFVFSAFVTPELLCPDRRSGLLGMYLASPLDRNTYLLSKAIAVTAILSLVTIGPLLLILLSYTILGQGPDSPLHWLITLGRIVAGGLCVAALHTSLSLAIASTTTRKAAAAAVIILTLVGSLIITGVLVFEAELSVYFQLFNFLGLPFESVLRIFGERTGNRGDEGYRLNEIPAAVTIGANMAWTFFFAAFVWFRYRRITVTK